MSNMHTPAVSLSLSPSLPLSLYLECVRVSEGCQAIEILDSLVCKCLAIAPVEGADVVLDIAHHHLPVVLCSLCHIPPIEGGVLQPMTYNKQTNKQTSKPNIDRSCDHQPHPPKMAAWCMSFFGMQPTLTQVPPRPHLVPWGVGFTKSKQATLAPCAPSSWGKNHMNRGEYRIS